MGGRALIVGGTGLAGRAIALELARDGWDVTVAARGTRPVPESLRRAGIRIARLDRREPAAVAQAAAGGVDLLVDAAAYDAVDAAQIVALAGRVGHAVVISSASVYADAAGRSLDEAGGPDTEPRLPVPIPETQATVPPAVDTYSTRKVAMERVLLEQDRLPVTVLRPGAIHGPGDRQAREWHFLKRALDGRRHVPVAYRGQSRFSTTSVANLSALVATVAGQPGLRVVNAVDETAPTVGDIARAIAAAAGHTWEIVGVEGGPHAALTPWSMAHPFVCDMSAARALGHRDVVTYEDAVVETCRWLTEHLASGDWRAELGDAARHHAFDYAAEDSLLRARRKAARHALIES